MKKQVGNIRWRIVALLFFATTINYIDRQVIGLLKPYIQDDLGWTELDYGYIVSAFQWAYAIGLLVSGAFLDRFGTRVGYAAAMVIWSVAGAMHAAARGVIGFGIYRFVLGIGESANFPAAIKTVAEWFPKKERALATGWFNSGSTVGAILAPIIVTATYTMLGWQWAFIITGSLGFIWLALWLPFYKTPGNHPGLSKEEFDYIHSDQEENEKRMPWIRILPHKQTIALCSTRFISDWVWWFFLFWLPDFLKKTHGMDIKEVVLPIIVIYLVSSVGGIAGGWMSSSMIKKGKSIDFSRKATILVCGLLALPIIAASQTENIYIAIACIALGTAAHQGWAANMFTIISDIFPKNAVASVVGLAGLVGSVGGALSAWFVGLVLELTESYLYIFIIAGSVYIINWLIIKLFIPKIEPLDIQ